MIPNRTFETGKLVGVFFRGVDYQEGIKNLIEHLSSIGTWHGSTLEQAYAALSKDPSDRIALETVGMWKFLGSWGGLACPTVRPDRAWGSNVCMSSIPKELFAAVRPPWPFFILDIPAEWGWKVWLGKRERPIEFVKIGHHEIMRSDGTLGDGWYISICSDNGDETPSPLILRTEELLGEIGSDKSIPGPCRETLKFIGPLIGAVCMSFANGETRRHGGIGRNKNGKRVGKYPTYHEYVVGRPVRVDLSQRLRDHIATASGKSGRRPSVQGVVRGHWKNQPCGSGQSERRFIHVEPYWRGPEDAPIAVRPHIITGQQ
jgi:hypothetical protein